VVRLCTREEPRKMQFLCRAEFFVTVFAIFEGVPVR
jgi:hypothetical protein